jgi:hypothetical protein
VPSHPKPTRTFLPAAPPGREDFVDGSSQTTLPTGRHDGFDFHGAETVIIDDTRHRVVRQARAAVAPTQLAPRRPPPPRRRAASPSSAPPPPAAPQDADEHLHNAPTLIIDTHRFRQRR